MKSASSGQQVSLPLKLKEALRQFVLLLRDRAPWRSRDFSYLDVQYEEYNALVQEFADMPLEQARVFEIGCGQRPYRLLRVLANEVDAYGIDMDKVVQELSAQAISQMYKKNGLERTAKTVVRYALFDRAENKQLRRYLNLRAGKPFDWQPGRIMHGSAADGEAWPRGSYDFIYSEDVFEHIPVDHLESVCALLAERLNPSGVAFIRPMVFTGIQGGHNVEWYDVHIQRERDCPPWDHLRAHRFPANTYLNQLTLADYRALFSRHLRILKEIPKRPNLGKEYMTPEIRAELSSYSDDELFSNHMGFVLTGKD